MPKAKVKEDTPFVSVVTPVYNGETYLAECIESVLSQDYSNWEYIIVNNCSTDRTQEIATYYASKDPRIRVHNNTQFLPMVRNWNHALKQISSESEFCKVLHADDRLFPECLTAMVRMAKERPDVGLVFSFRLNGNAIMPRMLPSGLLKSLLDNNNIINGDDAAKAYFEMEQNYFGSPSCLLIRSDLFRHEEQFHNEANAHCPDLEAWLSLMNECSLGFVRKMLVYCRRHDLRLTTKLKKVKPDFLSRYYMLRKFGRQYMEPAEYRQRLSRREVEYYKFLMTNVLRCNWELLRYHRRELRNLGVPFGPAIVLKKLIRYETSSRIMAPTSRLIVYCRRIVAHR